MCFCKPELDNPYLAIEREALAADETDDAWVPVYKSDVLEGETEVLFKKITINLNHLTLGNLGHRIRFALYSYDPNDVESAGSPYGSLETSVKEI